MAAEGVDEEIEMECAIQFRDSVFGVCLVENKRMMRYRCYGSVKEDVGRSGDGGRTRAGGRSVGRREGVEDAAVWDESLVFVAREDCIPGQDVEVVHMAVPINDDDPPSFWEILGEEVCDAGAAIAGSNDCDSPGGGQRHCTY